MIKLIRNFLLSVLLIEAGWCLFFPEWRFSNYYLRVVEDVTLPFIFFAFLACLAAIHAKRIYGFIFVAICSLPVAAFISWFSLHPLDAHSEEKDVAIIQRINNNYKLVSRKYFNYKHNVWQTDTVKVQEFFVFRKVMYQ